MTLRTVSAFLVLTLLAACGGEPDAPAGTDRSDSGNAPAPSSTAAEPTTESRLATLATGDLHPLDIPEPGRFSITLDEGSFEGNLPFGCSFDDFAPNERRDFSSTFSFSTENGRNFEVRLQRLVIQDPSQWTSIGGHERDRVNLHVTSPSKHGRDTSSTLVFRIRPDSPYRHDFGESDPPLIRIDSNERKVTAVGVAAVPYDEPADRHYVGPFAIAIHCPQD